jgi:hypothetical protein
MLQGLLAIKPATGRFTFYLMQLPQRLVENSLRMTGWEAGSDGREFFADGRESSEPRSDFAPRQAYSFTAPVIAAT